jgi:predicted DNA-binding protein with PD1-like motif
MIVSRMTPGNDLKRGLEDLIHLYEFKSGIILCIVGSLNKAVLRMSNGNKKLFKGLFEIVSAEGTITKDGIHIHISISDTEGNVFGGHLLEGCIIYTTAEIAIIKSKMYFERSYDPKTGYNELVVKNDQI